jgi:hypothetical protein
MARSLQVICMNRFIGKLNLPRQFYCCAAAMIIAAVVLSSILQLWLPLLGHEIKY